VHSLSRNSCALRRSPQPVWRQRRVARLTVVSLGSQVAAALASLALVGCKPADQARAPQATLQRTDPQPAAVAQRDEAPALPPAPHVLLIADISDPALSELTDNAGKAPVPHPKQLPTRRIVRITNHAGEPVSLRSTLTLERWTGSGWQATPLTPELRLACDAPPEPCTALVAGAELQPTWLASDGTAPCGCAGCGRLGAGRYRLVAHSCANAHAPIVGAPFELGAPDGA
jgi:hypothetical protein